MNIHVVQWYLDQATSYFALIESIILSTLVFKGINKNTDEYPASLKFFIYSIYITATLLFASTSAVCTMLPLLHYISANINQTIICAVIYICVPLFGATCVMAIVSFYIHRLYLSFKDTPLSISKRNNYIFTISFNAIFTLIGIGYYINADSSPYNIYREQKDYTGNAQTCSTHAKTHDSKGMLMVFGSASLFISISNLVILILFMQKLSILIRKTCENATDDFVNLMKKQTMLVSIAVFSTVFLWNLQAFMQFGQIASVVDYAINIFIIFLTFPFNKKYYKIFGCDMLTSCCCQKMEKCLKNRPIKESDEVNLSKVIQVNISTTSSTGRVP